MTKIDQISTISRDAELVLSRAQNGGWVLVENRDMHMVPRRLAAFTNANDLIAYLADLLGEPAAPEPTDG